MATAEFRKKQAFKNKDLCTFTYTVIEDGAGNLKQNILKAMFIVLFISIVHLYRIEAGAGD
jgi:hypothetical protein